MSITFSTPDPERVDDQGNPDPNGDYKTDVYYDSDDPATATVNVTYTVTLASPFSLASHEQNILWFAAADVEVATDPVEATMSALGELQSTQQTDTATYPRDTIFNTFGIADSDIETHYNANKDSTVYVENSGTASWTKTYNLSEPDLDLTCMYAVVWDSSIAATQQYSTLTSAHSAVTCVHINVAPFIRWGLIDGDSLYNGYIITDRTKTYTLSAFSSENFDATNGTGDNSRLNYYQKTGISGSWTFLGLGSSVTTTFPAVDTAYYIKAEASGTDFGLVTTGENTMRVTTVVGGGGCATDGVGFINNDRASNPSTGAEAISVGTLAGENDVSINLFADHVLDGTGAGTVRAANQADSSLDALRDIVVTTGQHNSSLDNDTNGLRFSEFKLAGNISATIQYTNETADQYGYYRTSNGSMVVTVDCNSTRSGDVTVTVGGASQSRVITGTGNVFKFTGLNTLDGHTSAPTGLTIAISIKDNSVNRTVSTSQAFTTSTGSGVITVGSLFV